VKQGGYYGTVSAINLRDVERNDKDASNQSPDISISLIIVVNIGRSVAFSLHQGNTESQKNLEQKFTFQIDTLSPHGINERFSFD